MGEFVGEKESQLMDAFGGSGGGGGVTVTGGLMKEGIVIWLVGGGRVINHRITC